LNAPLTVTFSAIDPTNGGLSSIVKLSSPTAGPVASLDIVMATDTATTYNSPFISAGTPSATGQYQIRASANAVGSGISSTVSVSQPAITGISIGTLAPGTHRVDSSINLDSPAPAGGLVVTLVSSDPNKVQVPATTTIPAGQSSLAGAFTITGLATTIDGTGRDHPVTITASVSDGSWISKTAPASVQQSLVLLVQNVATSRTLSSAPNTSIWVDLRCAASNGDCGLLNADLSITMAAINPSTGAASTIVSLSTPNGPATTSLTLTMAANTNSTYNAPFVTAGTPTNTGTYQITATATGVNSGASGVVTVTP
jgi:hypothetical protein